jgi:hypothetical protein
VEEQAVNLSCDLRPTCYFSLQHFIKVEIQIDFRIIYVTLWARKSLQQPAFSSKYS